ncbi:MAG: Y Y Y domain-containing protein [Saprospirales bacterium]|nr:MAG: Y Y Y domain-containing protein [Saprospirales bacterium]
MFCRLTFRFCLFFFSAYNLVAQELPPVISFSAEDYNADNQNWSITQADNNHIIVANNKGLLEFNGFSWRLYPSPNESIIRSVYAYQGLIYSGSFRDFGYWERDQYGQFQFTSLVLENNLTVGDNEEFWSILSYSDWVLFQSLESIFIYNTNNRDLIKIESNYGITKMMKVNDIIYFSKPRKGIFKIQDGQAILVSDHQIFQENLILNIYYIDNELLVQTNSSGIFYLWDEPQRWRTENDSLLNSIAVYNSIQDSYGNLILGTISDGVIKLSSHGELIYHITKRESLVNNTVLSLFEDHSGNIWLGLDNGINCVNQNSPISIFYDRSGDLGTVYTSIIYNGFLYLGTNQGLFYRPIADDDFSFNLVNGSVGQVWELFEYGNELFVAHNYGSFIVRNQKLISISEEQGAWCFRVIPEHPNLLLQGNYKGISILEKYNGDWTFRNKLPDFEISSRYIEFLDSNSLLISHEYKGVYRLSFKDNFFQTDEVERLESVEKGLYSSLVNFTGDILYANYKGIWRYDFTNKDFSQDEFLSKLYTPYTYSSGKLITTGSGRELWAFSKGSLYHLAPGTITGELEITPIPIHYSVRNAMVGYENIYQLGEGLYLFGNTQGYFIIDLNGFKSNRSKAELNFNQILVHLGNGEEKKYLPLNQKATLSNQKNNLEILFSMPDFENIFTSEYKYKLSGLMDIWSPWQSQNQIEFNNLPHGSYVLLVKGRIGENSHSNIIEFPFVIERPFLLSTGMIFLYVLIGFALGALIHSAYRTYYNQQRIRLQAKNQRELEYQESENKRKLMRLNNEKLQQDIESKNRELAISTMSLIKKNKVLNAIKSELSKSDGDPKQLKKVLNLINKNLKSGSDWEFFEKAFNNADRDFFKKVKNIHSSLTPDDLRLCAYLRLNLSSKEMAPLLGISPKSVEIKRYRLRKKMDLDSDVNLTEYILQI